MNYGFARRNTLLCCVAGTLVIAVSAIGHAAPNGANSVDWPQLRGATRDGLSAEKDWESEGATESVWTKSVGLGYSSVSISDGRLFTMGFDKAEGVDVVYCLDAETGEELWTHKNPANLDDKYHGGGSLTTPSIDGDLVYVTNRDGEFYCLDVEDGTEFWAKNLAEEHELERPTWGFGASPLVLDDMVIFNLGKNIAFDKDTMEPLWVTKDYGHSYSTPMDFDLDGRPAIATFAGSGLAILDRKTGEEIYHHPWKDKYDTNAATPIVIDNKVFISCGDGDGCGMLELGGDAPKVLWQNKSMKNHMNGCVLWDDHLYGFDEAVLKCLDLDGNEKWVQRGLGKGTVIAADGRLVIMSEKGELIVAEATPEKFQESSRVRVVSEDGVCWTTPVLVDGRIYCRNSLGELVCRDHRGDSKP